MGVKSHSPHGLVEIGQRARRPLDIVRGGESTRFLPDTLPLIDASQRGDNRFRQRRFIAGRDSNRGAGAQSLT